MSKIDLKSNKLSLEKAEKVQEKYAKKLFDKEKIAKAIFDASNMGLHAIRIVQDGMPYTLSNTVAGENLINWLTEHNGYRIEWVQRALSEHDDANPANYPVVYREMYIYWTEKEKFVDINDQNREDGIA